MVKKGERGCCCCCTIFVVAAFETTLLSFRHGSSSFNWFGSAMKRSLCSSDDNSLGDLMYICPTSDEQSPRNNQVYSREFHMMMDGLDEEDCLEEHGGHVSEKKRRLSVYQVKALEKNFEVENKLEPDRKVKLAQELGLQPRQVAVWFQNRRARWKTKQLERDYGVLKANYDAFKRNYDTLQHDNETLLKEIRDLKSKLKEENTESNQSVKEQKIVVHDQESNKPAAGSYEHDQEMTYESFNNDDGVLGISLFPDFRDGSSDSDSSAILNEDNNNPNSNGAISSANQLSKPTYQTQFVKTEEHNLFGDEPCNFLSDEQDPTLPWYCPQQWT